MDKWDRIYNDIMDRVTGILRDAGIPANEEYFGGPGHDIEYHVYNLTNEIWNATEKEDAK